MDNGHLPGRSGAFASISRADVADFVLGELQHNAHVHQIVRERVLEFSYFSPLAGAADLPENYHIVTVHLSSDGAQTRVSLRQDNNLTDEARERAERNWGVMLAGLKHFVEHNRPTIDTEPD